MAYRLNPIVAKASPNLYAAAKAANIPMDQGGQLEQFSWTVEKNKKLNTLRIDDARKEFNNLDPSAQEKLKPKKKIIFKNSGTLGHLLLTN